MTVVAVPPGAARPSTSSPEAAGSPGIAYVAGLDGLRAVAVLSVMAFHAGVGWAGGGLLGVDVFFVLSGYLVTSLLLDEHARSATVRLGRFWARRARRLLPALGVLLVGIGAYARWGGAPLSPSQLRGDALGTLAYFANWHYILTDQNYFVRYGAPSPLLHTWSLAVEEQFYLVWPVMALLVLRHRGRRGLAWTAAGLTVCSAALCAALYRSGASIDRLYYGTDTRAQSIMIGALLAVVVPIGGRDLTTAFGAARRGSARWAGAAGWAGAAVLAYCLHSVDGNGAFLYEGGFLVVAAAAGAVIAATVTRRGEILARGLAVPPLRYVGRISYGLYLYHWPIFLVLTANRTGFGGVALLALRFAVTFAVAAASFRLVERPIRARGRRRPGTARGHRGAGHLKSLAAVGVAAVVVAAVLVGTQEGAPAATNVLSVPGPRYVAPGGADAAHPERVLLIGDSLAETLGWGLSRDSVAWGVDVNNAGAVGCDLDPQSTVNIMGTVSRAAQGCPDWRRTWAGEVASQNPDVVLVLLGRWEEIDRLYGGKWTSVGGAAFDAHLRSELIQLIDICSARGAKVAFLTLPYIAQTTVQPDGEPWDMNRPSRTDAYNSVVRAAVAARPGRSAVVDLNKMLDPAGHYVSYIDGIRVRSTDDEHISMAGGEWLRPQLLPEAAALGAAHYHARTGRQ